MFRIDTVITLFELFSGQKIDDNEVFVMIARDELEKIAVPDAFETDDRLNFLCAAMANYRYQQSKAAMDRSTYTYAGEMDKKSDYTPLLFAEKMLKDYFNMCSDIIKPQNFIFMGFSKESDLND